MSAAWDEAGRHDGAYRQIWEDGEYGDWDFDALNVEAQDWDTWNTLPDEEFNEDFWNAPAYTEPYASSSTLDERSSPIVTQHDRRSPRRSPRTLYALNPDVWMGNAHSSPNNAVNNRPAHTLQDRTQTSNTTSNSQSRSAADDFAGGFNGESYDLDDPQTPSSFDGIDIDDILNTDDESDMPSSTRRRQRGEANTVDLTADSSPTRSDAPRHPRSLKRAAGQSSSQPRAKRSRRSSHSNQNSNAPPSPQQIEALDLTNEAPSAEEELRQTQQEAAIRAQQAAQASNTSSAPLKIGRRQCIICMELYTDATITQCGHVYCHECLTQALMAGEKNSERATGNCPVCRKPVSRKKGNAMILMNFMKRGAFREGKGRREGLSAFG